MGNNAILSVLGLIVFFGIINTTLNTKNAQSTQNISAFVSTDEARDIAYDGLSMARLRIDSSFANVSSFTLAGDVRGGSYSVVATAGLDSIQLVSTGTYEGTSYIATAVLFHHVKYLPAPKYPSAVSFQTGSLSAHTQSQVSTTTVQYSFSGSATIDGRNHDASGNLTSTRDGDAADVSALSSSDSVNIAQYLAQQNSTGGSLTLADQTIKTDPTVTPQAYLDTLASHADNVFKPSANDTLHPSSATWGTSSNPAIVFVNASASNSAVEFDSTYTGYGVLVVRGEASFAGNMQWNGLVIAYNNSGTYTLKLKGNSKVVGSVLLMNSSSSGSSLRMKDSSQVLYSQSAIQSVKTMPKLNKYIVNTVSKRYE